jgi:predicted kinase
MSAIIQEIIGGASPSMDDIISRLGDRLPLLHDLHATPQDAGWHAEGNVLIHTRMVLDETYKILETDLVGISSESRAALVLGAALHDIAKPLTTREREIDGQVRLVCPRHEQRGRAYLALALIDCLPYGILDQVMSLTGYHNAPKLLVVRNKAAGDYRRLSRQVDLELVYWLEVADIRGRKCVDKAKQLEHLELFSLFAKEYQCWNRSQESAWDHAIRQALPNHPPATVDFVAARATLDAEEGLISTPEEAISKSFAYRDAYPEVVVMAGLSGSGKTTWITKNLADHEVISLDDIRTSLSSREDQQNNSKVLRIAKEKLREALRAKKRIVWDATSLRTDFRSGVIDLALDYGALVTIVAFLCPPEELARRNKARTNPVPPAVRLKQALGTQWPEVTEAHRFLTIDANGNLLAARGCLAGLPYNLENQNDVR